MDPRQELQAILRNVGGLRLGYRLMKESLHEHVRIMYTAENACWDYYTNEIETVKSPADNLRRSWELESSWAKEPHLFATLHDALLDPAKLNFMQIPMGQSTLATKALSLSWTIQGRRGWTMAKHSAPPDCYASILRPGDDYAEVRQTCAAKTKTQHENALALESARHTVADAQELWESCLYLDMRAVRLVMEYFRRDKYSPSSRDGRHLLMGLVATMADNKAVEDIHAPLRLATKGNCNLKLSSQTKQDVINHSDVLECRNIPHGVDVSKDPLPGLAKFMNDKHNQCSMPHCSGIGKLNNKSPVGPGDLKLNVMVLDSPTQLLL